MRELATVIGFALLIVSFGVVGGAIIGAIAFICGVILVKLGFWRWLARQMLR